MLTLGVLTNGEMEEMRKKISQNIFFSARFIWWHEEPQMRKDVRELSFKHFKWTLNSSLNFQLSQEKRPLSWISPYFPISYHFFSSYKLEEVRNRKRERNNQLFVLFSPLGLEQTSKIALVTCLSIYTLELGSKLNP